MYNPVMFVSHFETLRRTKALNEGRDISLRTVAKESGLSQATVLRLRSGNMNRLYLSTLNTLCVYFGVKSVADLIEFQPDPAPPAKPE